MAGIDQFNYPVTVNRTRRKKTVALRIVDGTVYVTAPRRLSEKRITALLVQKEPWIRKKLALDAGKPKLQPRQFASGEAFPYLGRHYRLALSDGERGDVRLVRGHLRLSLPEKLEGEPRKRFIRNRLAHWYIDNAGKWLEARTQEFSARLGVRPGRVEVKYFKSRWGSCSVDGTIKYNWRIVMAPHRMIDYLVVHELAHLVHHNHSPAYWKFVETCLPDYREPRNWLKENGASLSLDLAPAKNV